MNVVSNSLLSTYTSRLRTWPLISSKMGGKRVPFLSMESHTLEKSDAQSSEFFAK